MNDFDFVDNTAARAALELLCATHGLSHPVSLDGRRHALFSKDGLYRYLLAIEVNPAGTGACGFVGCNPSTATEAVDDPTIRKCKEFSRRWGYRWLWMLNCYAIRGKDPKTVKAVTEPVGDANNQILAIAAACLDKIVAAWGRNAGHLARGSRVRRELKASGVTLFCLGQNDDGSPEHPLYIPYDRPLLPLEAVRVSG